MFHLTSPLEKYNGVTVKEVYLRENGSDLSQVNVRVSFLHFCPFLPCIK